MSQLSQFYINSGGGDGVESVVAGSGISVDNTDPKNPVVNNDGVFSVQAGSGISVDNTDPNNPIVSASAGNAVQAVNATNNSGITVNNSDPKYPILGLDVTVSSQIEVTEGTDANITLPLFGNMVFPAYIRLKKTVGVKEVSIYIKFDTLHNSWLYGTQFSDATVQSRIMNVGDTTTEKSTGLKIFNLGLAQNQLQYCTLDIHSQSNNNHCALKLFLQEYNSTTMLVFYTLTKTKG